MGQQTCKVCRRADCFDFNMPDWLWEKVVPERYRNTVVCLCCFDRFAAERKIDYTAYLKRLYFAGQKALLEFRVAEGTA